jgi:hypothetical protein
VAEGQAANETVSAVPKLEKDYAPEEVHGNPRVKGFRKKKDREESSNVNNNINNIVNININSNSNSVSSRKSKHMKVRPVVAPTKSGFSAGDCVGEDAMKTLSLVRIRNKKERNKKNEREE